MVIKRCFVPLCKNNSYITPNKIFILVPYDKILRESWFKAVNQPFVYCPQSLFCCEDHFNLAEDVENWNYYKTFGKRLTLKKGILPKPNLKQCLLDVSSSVTALNVKRRRYYSRTTQTIEPVKPPKIDVAVNTKCIKSLKGTTCESCLRKERKYIEQQIFVKYSSSSSFSEPSSNDDRSASTSSTNSSIRERLNMIQQEQFKIERNCRLYLGLPEDVFVLINTLKNKMDYTNILITLKKIRTDDSFHRLSIDFCKNKSTAYYYNVESIIDCFEIEIQKPTDSMAQVLTWSSYKSCNTLKFLISSTPNGLVNFISPALGGRASDLEVVKKSGYLDVIPHNTVIMADRGFKHIVPLLNHKGATLIKPPSVSSSEKMTKYEIT